jgi:hypothetical protein
MSEREEEIKIKKKADGQEIMASYYLKMMINLNGTN